MASSLSVPHVQSIKVSELWRVTDYRPSFSPEHFSSAVASGYVDASILLFTSSRVGVFGSWRSGKGRKEFSVAAFGVHHQSFCTPFVLSESWHFAAPLCVAGHDT